MPGIKKQKSFPKCPGNTLNKVQAFISRHLYPLKPLAGPSAPRLRKCIQNKSDENIIPEPCVCSFNHSKIRLQYSEFTRAGHSQVVNSVNRAENRIWDKQIFGERQLTLQMLIENFVSEDYIPYPCHRPGK